LWIHSFSHEYILFPMTQQLLGSQGFLIIKTPFTITFRHTTRGRTPLDKRSARLRDLYLTTHNTHKRQSYMPPVGFKPTIPASEQFQTCALERAATGIGFVNTY
jgi:hypothetical protein